MSEFLVLDIEEFAEKAACGADLACFVGSVPAFRAGEVKGFAHFNGLYGFFKLFEERDSFILSIFNGVAKDQNIYTEIK